MASLADTVRSVVGADAKSNRVSEIDISGCEVCGNAGDSAHCGGDGGGSRGGGRGGLRVVRVSVCVRARGGGPGHVAVALSSSRVANRRPRRPPHPSPPQGGS